MDFSFLGLFPARELLDAFGNDVCCVLSGGGGRAVGGGVGGRGPGSSSRPWEVRPPWGNMLNPDVLGSKRGMGATHVPAVWLPPGVPAGHWG